MTIQYKTFVVGRETHQHYYQVTDHESLSPAPPFQAMAYTYQVRGTRTSGEKIIHPISEPTITEINTLITALENEIQSGTPDKVKEILQGDWIFECTQIFKDFKTYEFWEAEHEKFDIIKQRQYRVRPIIEELLINHLPQFKNILEKAAQKDLGSPSQFRRAILNCLQYLNLAPDESIDFSNMDLSYASFEGAKLGTSNFEDATLTLAIASNCDLRYTNITSDQLNVCIEAKTDFLPPQWQLWQDAVKANLAFKLDQLNNYASIIAKKENEAHFKVAAIKKLYDNYYSALTQEGGDPSFEAKQKIWANLVVAKEILSSHRDFKFLAAEVVSFFCLLGVFYLIGASIQKYRTGHFGLFAQPKSERMVQELQESVLKLKA